MDRTIAAAKLRHRRGDARSAGKRAESRAGGEDDSTRFMLSLIVFWLMDSFLCKTLIDIIKTSANVLPTFDFEEFDDVFKG